MRRVLITFICAVVIMSTIPVTNVLTSEPNQEVRFVLLGTPLCKSNFLCWEIVPDTLKYEIIRDEVPVATLSSGVNRYIDYDLELIDGSTHYYKVRAINDEEVIIAKSLSTVLTNTCYDESECYTNMEFTIDSYMYRVDGVMFGPMETPPQIIEGRTFLVIRFVAEAVSAEMGWVGEERKITITTKSGRFIELWVGKSEARIDGKVTPIDPENPDVVPVISNGRTLLPLRFVGEQLGATGDNGIIWHAEERMVELNIFDETCVSPYHWRLDVDSIDRIQGSVSCSNELDVQFSVITEDAVPEDITEGSRLLVTGIMRPELQNGIPIIDSDSIDLIETPDDTDNVIVKVIEISCEENRNILTVETQDGEIKKFQSNDSNACSLSADTWLFMSVDEDTVYDWNHVVDEVVPSASKEFGPELMKVTEIDLQQSVIRCKAPDEYYKDWRSAEVHVFRIREPDLVEDIEELRCYNVWYKVDQMNRVFLTKIERIDCPAQFTVEFTRVPEVVMSGTGDRIKVKITNNNEFPRRYKPIFRSEEFDGYFKPERDEIEINPGESDIFNMNFAGSYHMEGVVKFEAGASCGDIEVVKGFEVLFEKPSVEIVDIPYVVKITKGGYDSFNFDVINHSNKRLKVDNYVNAPDFPGKIFPANEYYYINPHESREFKIKVHWNIDVEFGSKHNVEYGVSIGDYIDKSAVTLQCISDIYPDFKEVDLEIDGNSVNFTGEIDWKGLEPSSVSVCWDDYIGWIETYDFEWEEVGDFPFEHEYKRPSDYMVIIIAEAETGEASACFYLFTIKGSHPHPYVTYVDWNEDEPKVLNIEGFIDWAGYDEGKMMTTWYDGVVTYGLPCEYHAKEVSCVHLGLMFTKAESGHQDYLFYFFFDYCTTTFMPLVFPINTQNANKILYSTQMLSLARERIGRYEDIHNAHIDYMRVIDDDPAEFDPDSRTGGRYIP